MAAVPSEQLHPPQIHILSAVHLASSMRTTAAETEILDTTSKKLGTFVLSWRTIGEMLHGHDQLAIAD
jgi:hypothetical protein